MAGWTIPNKKALFYFEPANPPDDPVEYCEMMIRLYEEKERAEDANPYGYLANQMSLWTVVDWLQDHIKKGTAEDAMGFIKGFAISGNRSR